MAAAPLLLLLLLSPVIGIVSITVKTIITGLEKTDEKASSTELLKPNLVATQLPRHICLVTLTTTTVGHRGIMGVETVRLTTKTLRIIPM
ncbi:MAG: hypothetical protein QXF26_08450 [Candidatus Bathyarchaeia archaeon]